jgi:peptidoglycan/xylan/chitin deacetylase (PgdA/CDA1 family)
MTVKPLILMYHRVAEAPVDPWDLAVSPDHFAEQLDVLRRTRHPLPLMDFVRDLQAGTLPAHAVAVTFDDGYADNLLAAKPRLAAAGIPATVFLATGYLGRAGEFWWGELARLLLWEAGPRSLEIVVRGHALRFNIEGEFGASETGSWCAMRDPPRTQRQAAYLAIWQALRPLEEPERVSLMAELRDGFAGRAPDGGGRAMTAQEARTLAGDGLVAIGAHSVTHPLLAQMDAPSRRREIAESKLACEALTEEPVTAFAYPYGNFDSDVREEVRAAGFTAACATIPGPATAASDPLALPRLQVLDQGGDAFEQALCSASAGG